MRQSRVATAAALSGLLTNSASAAGFRYAPSASSIRRLTDRGYACGFQLVEGPRSSRTQRFGCGTATAISSVSLRKPVGSPG